MGDVSTRMWQNTSGDVTNGDINVIVLNDIDEEEAGEETILDSLRAIMYMGFNGLGHGTT
jgi:hypothetical protein